ncbi:MAG TPA: DUF362 domain-containing protein [Anaerolineae bacterium]|nr:DUF362 domain-containing protein [Anaerolineae bacterium]
MEKPRVAIVHREHVPGTPAEYDEQSVQVVYSMLREALEPVGGIGSVVQDGDKVVVRANSCWAAKPNSGIAGDPRLVEALMRLIRDETSPSEVVVADRSSIGADTAEAFEVNGVGAAARRGGADRILALEQDERIPVQVPDPMVLLRPVYLSRTMLEADKLIYVPKMKVHKLTHITLAMKMNQGSLDWYDAIRNHGADMHAKMVDMLRVMRPHLSIVDALWPMQGQGPGSPYPEDLIKDFNVILAGKDPVAVDTVGATIMGFDAKHEVPMLRGAEMAGLGVATLDQIEVVGTPIERVKRHFRRGNISLVGVHPKIQVYMGRACDGCLHFTRTGMDVYLANPELWEDVDKVTFIMGRDAEVPETLEHNPPKSYVFVVGDCAAEYQERGIHLPGCASTSMHFTLFPGKTSEQVLERYEQLQPPKVNLEGYLFPD